VPGYEEMKDERPISAGCDGWYTPRRRAGNPSLRRRRGCAPQLTELLALPGDAAAGLSRRDDHHFYAGPVSGSGKKQYEWQPEPGCGWRVDLRAHSFTPIG
jgi:hypothetical protein